jgi:uncharacterized protein (DUF362 family)
MKLPVPKLPTISKTISPRSSKVVVLKTTPQTVLEDIQRAMEMAGIKQNLKMGVPTIIKDNISWHFPFPSANSTPWQIEGTVLGLRKNGFDEIVCVQNKTVVTDAFKGEDLNKFTPIFKKYDIPVLFNFHDTDMKWIEYKPKTSMLVLDQIFHMGIHIPDYFIGKNIVHLPTMKCHIHTTTTGAMKNAFGGLLNTYRHYSHSWIHETLVDLLAIQKEIHPGIFAVMDGTTAGNGPGPRTMEPIEKNIIIASADQVAIDAVSAKLMGFDPLSIKYINLAHHSGLGCGDPRDIQIIGEDCTQTNWNFSVGSNAVKFAAKIFWYGPLKNIQSLFFRTPLVYLFILASELYHDYYRWTFKDKKVFKEWLNRSPWGKLFASYPTSEK